MIEVELAFPEKGFDPATKKLRDVPFYPLLYRYGPTPEGVQNVPSKGTIIYSAKGIGRYYRGELLQAFNWCRRMRPDMNEKQLARMIT
jgi:hypothetical protein